MSFEPKFLTSIWPPTLMRNEMECTFKAIGLFDWFGIFDWLGIFFQRHFLCL
ncbi:hypothetical protein SAR116_0818 [Candidatus Puniceispirillum marinum IMCC1322]|uniref:Uncharacterized protein n=1 Tax=Puniceispirillum marinum (strain IMCC1322) TaxID=488538 RepID=D5BS13_PUNMI|nr:hypothetical protein SAR116_0818 [Candidatus Puniceispirillum marinum IMCC1322]